MPVFSFPTIPHSKKNYYLSDNLILKMAENKKSFVLYADLLSVVKKIVLKDRENKTNYGGELFLHILEYVNDLEPVAIDFIVEMAFEPIKLQLKRDLKKYELIKEKRSNAGKVSAESRQQKPTKSTSVDFVEQTSTNPTVNDNVNVTVNDNVNESKEEEGFRAPDLSKSNLFREPNFPTKNEVLECFVQNGGTKDMAKAFWERNESTGWFYKGSPITNFRNMVPSFVSNWNRNNSKVVPIEKSVPLKTVQL